MVNSVVFCVTVLVAGLGICAALFSNSGATVVEALSPGSVQKLRTFDVVENKKL